MSSREQRRKEKHKRKRQDKKDQLRKRAQGANPFTNVRPPQIIPGSNARHRERIASQIPQAWPGETAEDAAVFDDQLLAALAPDAAVQVSAVREALKCACELRGDEALKCTSSIPRSSPCSEWRLFVRGLVSWLKNEFTAAGESWERLNPERRPGRIATVMMNSLNAGLENASLQKPTHPAENASSIDWSQRLDERLLYHARLLRRVRFDRAAIRVAEAGLRAPEEFKELLIGPGKLHWLLKFAEEYRETEPDLVAALQAVALRRAFIQDFADVFKTASKVIRGPQHDPQNLLLSFFFELRFTNERGSKDLAEQSLNRYLKESLPKNEALTKPLRAAIASSIHLAEAISKMQSPTRMPFSFFGQPEEDTSGIRQHLKEAIKALPTHRLAHKSYADWIESKLDEQRLSAKQKVSLGKELADVMKRWSQGVPDEVRPRLWLIDYLFENEELEEAKPHVEWMAASRHENPQVRAIPWKWQILEAMRLCRRKAWLSDVAARLQDAERLWPAWLSKEWLPYLQAAVILRSGKTDDFEATRTQILANSGLKRNSLTDACMMLGAAQLMRVPAADLKPLRVPVDTALKNLRNVSDAELLRVSQFFWDLHRSQLLYPAYRMHGRKIADQIRGILRENPRRVVGHMEDPEIRSAILLCAEIGCFGDGYSVRFPPVLMQRDIRNHPICVAARVNAYLKLKHHWSDGDFRDEGSLLREASKSERDPFYRSWFVELAEEFDEVMAENKKGPFGFESSFFGAMFGGMGQQNDDDDDEDTLYASSDSDCDCPACRAARKAAAAR